MKLCQLTMKGESVKLKQTSLFLHGESDPRVSNINNEDFTGYHTQIPWVRLV